MRARIPALVVALASSVAAAGQNINIDFGLAGLVPSDGYAAAGLGGYWNALELADRPNGRQTFAPGTLQSVDSEPTLIGMTVTSAGTTELTDHPFTFGDDASLLDDFLLTAPGTTSIVSLAGIEPGVYHVFVYTWAPADPSAITQVTIDDAVTSFAGGAWTGGLAQGVTHEVYAVEISDGSLEIAVTGASAESAGYLNAVQIIDTTESPVPPEPDLDHDGIVGFQDLLMFLAVWSEGHGCDGIIGFAAVGCTGDVNHDLDVDFEDLLIILSAWSN